MPNNPPPTLADILNKEPESFAYSLVFRLLSHHDLLIEGKKYEKSVLIIELKSWAKGKYWDIFYKNHPFPNNDNEFLSQLLEVIHGNFKTQETAPNLPSPQRLLELQKQLQEHEDWLDAIARVSDANTLDYLKQFDIAVQIKRVQEFQQRAEQETTGFLPPYLAAKELAAERRQIETKVSQQILKTISSTKEAFDENMVWETIEDLCDSDPQVAMALSSKARDQLANNIYLKVTSQQKVREIRQAQQTLDKAKTAIAPNRNDLKKYLSLELGLSPQEAEAVMCNLEANWPPSPNPASQEIQQAIIKSLTKQAKQTIQNKKTTEEDAVSGLTVPVQNYYVSAPLAQNANQTLKPVSKQAIAVARNLKTTPVVAQNLLAGVTPESIQEEIDRLTKLNELEKAKKLEELRREFDFYTDKYLDSFPSRLRKQIKKARWQAKIAGFLENINPFCLGFYRKHLPSPAKYVETKVQHINAKIFSINNKVNHIKNAPYRFVYKHGLRPIGILRARNLRWRWQMWRGLCSRIPNRRLRRFMYRLPDKFLPSFWAKSPAYLFRQGTARFLLWTGNKLGNVALGNACRTIGAKLLTQGFGKLLAVGLGAASGVATAGVGTVITLAVAAASLLVNPKLLKKLGKLAANALSGLVILAAQLPFTFLGLIIGAGLAPIFGPAGILVGGAIGFLADKLFGALGGFGGITNTTTATTSLALAAPAEAATAAGYSTTLTSPAVIGVVGSVGAVGVGAVITVISVAGALNDYGPTMGTKPNESELVKISKTANPTSLTNASLESNPKISYTIEIIPQKGAIKIKVKDEISLDTKQSPLPAVPTLKLISPSIIPEEISKPLILTYELSLNNKYKDTRIKNSFYLEVLEKDKSESVTDSAFVNIGSPPKPSSAQLAENIVNILLKCAGLSATQTNGVLVNRASWPTAKECLAKAGIDSGVIGLLAQNFASLDSSWDLMQCGVFANAVSQNRLPKFTSAKDLCQNPGLKTNWSELGAGDYIVSGRGDFGHIAIVILVDGDIINVAEAMGDTGSVQIRKTLTKTIMPDYYCGYLKGE